MSVKVPPMHKEEMQDMEEILLMVKEYLPATETELGAYTFLAPDKIWMGETKGIPFVVVAEDRYPSNKGGFCLAVTVSGAVYILDLDNVELTDYCAAGFPQFIEIMKLYQAACKTIPSPM